MSKTITAVFTDEQFSTTVGAFQWDSGDRLKFEGLDLPESYEVHFANARSGVAITKLGDADGVLIPTECFANGADIFAWLVLVDSNGFYTEYQVTIPIYRRARPAGVLPPGQQSNDAKTIIEETVNAWMDAHAGEVGAGLSEAIKTALLQLAEKVAYIDDGGASYYQALYNALNNVKELTSISAQFTQGDAVIYDTGTLDSLRSMLWVMANYSDGSSELTEDYSLSGALETGTSTITVVLDGQTATFDVVVTHYETELSSISAVYTQSGTVYDTDSLDSLKTDLVVTATYSDSSTATIAAEDYTLSGTLTEGTSTITVSYSGKTATFTVTVSTNDTTAVIMTEGVCWSKTAPNTVDKEGFGITQWYGYEFTQEALESCTYWDSTNGYMTTTGWCGIKYYIADVNTLAAGYTWPSSANYKNALGNNGTYTEGYSLTKNAVSQNMFSRQQTKAVEANGVSFTIPLLDIDDCYAYWYKPYDSSILPAGVSVGDIIFAGKNTPYYGLTNISEAST